MAGTGGRGTRGSGWVWRHGGWCRAAGRDLGWVFISTAPPKSLEGTGYKGRRWGLSGCGNCPSGATWWGRGWTLGVLSAVEPQGWPSGPCLGGGSVIAVKGVHLWRRLLKAQQSTPSGCWWGSPVSSGLSSCLPSCQDTSGDQDVRGHWHRGRDRHRAGPGHGALQPEVRAGLGPADPQSLGWAEGMGPGVGDGGAGAPVIWGCQAGPGHPVRGLWEASPSQSCQALRRG